MLRATRIRRRLRSLAQPRSACEHLRPKAAFPLSTTLAIRGRQSTRWLPDNGLAAPRRKSRRTASAHRRTFRRHPMMADCGQRLNRVYPHYELQLRHIASGASPGRRSARHCSRRRFAREAKLEEGEPRVTPRGNPLTGHYDTTYCVFDLGAGDDGELAERLRLVITALFPRQDFLLGLRATGGSLNLFITWTVGERGEMFDCSLLSGLASLGIDLGIAPVSAN